MVQLNQTKNQIVTWLKGNWKSASVAKKGSLIGQKLDSSKFLEYQPDSTWILDEALLVDDTLRLSGWFLSKDATSDPVLKFNGERAEIQNFKLPRPDILRLFWFVPDAELSGFDCTVLNFTKRFSKVREGVVSIHSEKTNTAFNKDHDIVWLNPNYDSYPFPDAQRRARVHGAVHEASFRVTGYSSFKKLEHALLEITGSSFSDYKTILDWGCGCGRVLRYFTDVESSSVFGADIDLDNIQWCRDNYSFAQFNNVPLLPPSELGTEKFNLVIGISVFTHLKEDAQKVWLSELSRVVAPGGVLLLTILGSAGVARSGISNEWLKVFESKGFLEAGSSLDLVGHISDDTYYVNTLHSLAYIKSVWGEYFQILGVKEGYIGNHQDLIILRKL